MCIFFFFLPKKYLPDQTSHCASGVSLYIAQRHHFISRHLVPFLNIYWLRLFVTKNHIFDKMITRSITLWIKISDTALVLTIAVKEYFNMFCLSSDYKWGVRREYDRSAQTREGKYWSRFLMTWSKYPTLVYLERYFNHVMHQSFDFELNSTVKLCYTATFCSEKDAFK